MAPSRYGGGPGAPPAAVDASSVQTTGDRASGALLPAGESARIVLATTRPRSVRPTFRFAPLAPDCQSAIPGMGSCMGSSGLLLMAWACGLATVVDATGSSVEPLGAPDECARCFAENERLASRMEQLLMRVGQLEAELARGDGQGAREGLKRCLFHDD